MFRVLVKTVMLASALLLLVPGGQARAAVILQYHSVADDMPPATSVTPEQFRLHLSRLEQEGFRVVRLDELVRLVRAGEPHEDVVAITFDDGFANLAEHAFPLLEQHGWQGSVFVTAAQVGGARMLTVAQLKMLHERGHLVLNHGRSHDHLVRKRPGESSADHLARVRDDLLSARLQLRRWLARDGVDEADIPDYLAWPYGEYSPELQRLARSEGFLAFGQQSGAMDGDTDLQAIPRVAVNRRYADWPSLRDKLRARALPVRKRHPESGITESGQPTLTLWLSGPVHPVSCFVDGRAVSPVYKDGLFRDAIVLQSPWLLSPGRHRYTCTAPADEGRFYWYSWQWMVREGERWYAEP